jgi:hypothetical protein
MLAVLGVEKAAERFDEANDHEKIVAAKRKHGVDQIVTRALLSQVYFEPVGEEGEQVNVLGANLSSRPRNRSIANRPSHVRGQRPVNLGACCSRVHKMQSRFRARRMTPSAARRSA